MKNETDRNGGDLEWPREQIMTFACGAHAFGVELDEIDPNVEWNAVFVVKFQGSDREERLFCRARKGEQHVRFWVDVTFDEATWDSQLDDLLAEVSKFDVSLSSVRSPDNAQERLARLSTRAWVPHFSQRIFGLTFSNLMNCKAAIVLKES